MPITRRRSSDTSDEPEEKTTSRRRRSSEEDDSSERPTRRRRASSEDSDSKDERPARRRRSSSEDDSDEKPSRRRRSSGDEDDSTSSRRPRRRGSAGFDSYSQKKRSNSNFADEFKPDSDVPTLIKVVDEGPFDTYNQHWIEDGLAKGRTRHSFVCLDDEYFEEDADYDKGCPLCGIGEPASTYSLFNIIDMTNPRKPELKVWRTPPAVTDKIQRMSKAKRTSPINRTDLYFEVTKVQKKNKTEWDVQPVKADEVEEDFEIDAFTDDELETWADKRFTDRTAVTKVDSYEEIEELADSLD